MSESSEKEVLVSVIMPAFNAEKTIKDAIQSVLHQTYKKFELIIVNDASTDHTLSIAVEYAKKDERIRILNNMGNLGVSCSRNHGVEVSNGELIAFLDSDDMWKVDKLEKQVHILLDDLYHSICFTGSSYIDDQGFSYHYVLSIPSKITYQDLLKQNLISCSSVLVKKSAIVAFPMMNDSMIHEDLITWLKILEKESYAIGINEPLLIYRLHKNSKSGNKLYAAKMQWRTYHIMGVKRKDAIKYFMIYAWRNIKKYRQIYKSSDRLCSHG